MAEGKKRHVSQPPPELLNELDFFENLGMMEMIVDTGLDKKMKSAEMKKAEAEKGKKP